MFCKNCGSNLSDETKYCGKCGDAVVPASVKVALPDTTKGVPEEKESRGIIKCGNCDYVGYGEPARSWLGVVLAWLCVIFAPLITIIYFLATSKYRCPKCKSTFVGIKNKEGVFSGQKGSSRILLWIVGILVGVAVLGIMASIVLVSLSSAREKAQEASFKAQVTSIIPVALTACDQRNITQKDLMGSGEKQHFDSVATNKSLKQSCGSEGRGTFSFSVNGIDDYEKFSADCSELGCNFHSINESDGSAGDTETSTQADSIEDVLLETSKEINISLPMMVDEVTQLTTTTAVGNELSYSYKFLGTQKITQSDLVSSLQEDIINQACTTPETRALFDAGGAFKYRYYDINNKFIGEILVNKENCK